MEEPKDRLRRARASAGYESPADAARRVRGINQNTITSNENGNRPISKKMAQVYADAFGVSAGWILYGEGEAASAERRTIPLKGKVGAGQQVEAIDNDDWDEAPMPPEARPGTIAVVVDGVSMFPAIEDGSLIYYSRHLPPDVMVNQRAVVQLADGRVFVKIIRPGSRPGFWTLQSVNAQYADILDVVVEWAAPIDWIKPRG
ncbi:LexA family transcriptional regulator [Zhengella mangrovi]|nr:S24 family peptidase [Zhengella mangrovi]